MHLLQANRQSAGLSSRLICDWCSLLSQAAPPVARKHFRGPICKHDSGRRTGCRASQEVFAGCHRPAGAWMGCIGRYSESVSLQTFGCPVTACELRVNPPRAMLSASELVTVSIHSLCQHCWCTSHCFISRHLSHDIQDTASNGLLQGAT